MQYGLANPSIVLETWAAVSARLDTQKKGTVRDVLIKARDHLTVMMPK